MQYRRGDVPGLVVAFPWQTDTEADERFIAQVLAVAGDRNDLDGAEIVVAVRMTWWRDVWNRPLGPILYAQGAVPLPETGEEVERWRSDTVRALDLADIEESLSSFLSAESLDQAIDVIRSDPRLVSTRWRSTLRALEDAPRRIEHLENVTEEDVAEAIATRFSRLRILQHLGPDSLDVKAEDLASPAVSVLTSAHHESNSSERQSLVAEGIAILGSAPLSALTASINNAIVAVMHGDPGREPLDADDLVSRARKAVEYSDQVVGVDHEIACSSRLNLAVALEERAHQPDDADLIEAETILLDVARRTARLGSALASDVAINLATIEVRRPGERADSPHAVSKLLDEGKHIAALMNPDDRRQLVVSLVDEAAALRSMVTGPLRNNALLSLQKVEEAGALDAQWNLLTEPERVLLAGNRLNSLYELRRHAPTEVALKTIVDAALDAVAATASIHELHPSAIDTLINAGAILLNVFSDLDSEETAADPDLWRQARDVLEDAADRARRLAPLNLRTLRAFVNLASVYGRVVDGAIADADRCAELLEQVIAGAPPNEPDYTFTAAVNLGQLRMGQGRWLDAASAYDTAREAQLHRIRQARTTLTKFGQILLTGDLAARRALAFAQAGELERAVEALEENRAQLARPRSATSRTPRTRNAVIHAATSDYGSAVIIQLPSGDTPGFVTAIGSRAVKASVRELLGADSQSGRRQAFDALEVLIGPAITGPVAAIIDASEEPIDEIEVVACGALASTPLHCVASNGERWVDKWRVRYRVAATTPPTKKSPSPTRTVGVFDPDGNLPYARTEREAVAGWSRELIEPPEGHLRRAWLLANLRTATSAHLACHAALDAEDPFTSAFSMGGEVLTVADLDFGMGLELVVAPACQSGATNEGAPDEILGVGHAFAHAGATAVIASLWDADDVATAFVVAVLYRELADGADACDALARAQREASSMTRADVDTLSAQRIRDELTARWLPYDLALELSALCANPRHRAASGAFFDHAAEWGVLSFLEP